jgi:hypothetical protein
MSRKGRVMRDRFRERDENLRRDTEFPAWRGKQKLHQERRLGDRTGVWML